MNRKKFIMGSILTAFSISAFGSVIKNNDGLFKINEDCETTNDILGPFYRKNAPTRSNLIHKDLKGSKVALKGKIYGSDCGTVLKNTLIEIWHCNTDGKYDNDTDQFLHRGKQLSDENGDYKFDTILPGKYLNGKLFRPSHIHFRVTHKKTKELVSQIYFKGDPHITKDNWASDNRAEHRILPIILEDINGNLVINFDIYLKDK
tara:strand:+ start:519 stop:1130 length:612 start_codon:yes stop_codon:yes gene_type:complete